MQDDSDTVYSYGEDVYFKLSTLDQLKNFTEAVYKVETNEVHCVYSNGFITRAYMCIYLSSSNIVANHWYFNFKQFWSLCIFKPSYS